MEFILGKYPKLIRKTFGYKKTIKLRGITSQGYKYVCTIYYVKVKGGFCFSLRFSSVKVKENNKENYHGGMFSNKIPKIQLINCYDSALETHVIGILY